MNTAKVLIINISKVDACNISFCSPRMSEIKEEGAGPSSAWPNQSKDYELKEVIGVGATALLIALNVLTAVSCTN